MKNLRSMAEEIYDNARKTDADLDRRWDSFVTEDQRDDLMKAILEDFINAKQEDECFSKYIIHHLDEVNTVEFIRALYKYKLGKDEIDSSARIANLIVKSLNKSFSFMMEEAFMDAESSYNDRMRCREADYQYSAMREDI